VGGCPGHIDRWLLRIWDEKRCLIARIRRSAARLYLLWLKIAKPVCLIARRSDEAWRWHERYDHLHFDTPRKLTKEGMVHGIRDIEHVE
jgi:hypothetical protein